MRAAQIIQKPARMAEALNRLCLAFYEMLCDRGMPYSSGSGLVDPPTDAITEPHCMPSGQPTGNVSTDLTDLDTHTRFHTRGTEKARQPQSPSNIPEHGTADQQAAQKHTSTLRAPAGKMPKQLTTLSAARRREPTWSKPKSDKP
ncbi:Hypothetical predicted protein [Pelobates cultripes]|uniref:Uncharacterized protein n=1 Tax=Pelobates cultripes TaxID=61616 RepID=A0AAD1SAM3_PELCU|nr:Hypothetical predicted protein [Pelobates cultripes]